LCQFCRLQVLCIQLQPSSLIPGNTAVKSGQGHRS
jgi:hypothetical protein